MNQKDKKKELMGMIKDLVKIQSEAVQLKNLNVAKGLEYLINGLTKETLDFLTAINYIDNVLKNAKSKSSKALWAEVVKRIRQYFETIS